MYEGSHTRYNVWIRIKLHISTTAICDITCNRIKLHISTTEEAICDITCTDRIKLHISTTEEAIRDITRYNMYGSCTWIE